MASPLEQLILQNLATPQMVNPIQQAITTSPSYGLRTDMTPKGTGYFGSLPHVSGNPSTELSSTVNFDGQDRLIPLLVPTLQRSEIQHLLGGNDPTRDIVQKAVQFARARMSQGLSPFAGNQEIPYGISVDNPPQ